MCHIGQGQIGSRLQCLRKNSRLRGKKTSVNLGILYNYRRTVFLMARMNYLFVEQ